MKNHRVRQNVTPATRLKAKVWFSKVSSIENLTAYRLDHLFNQYPHRIKSDRVRIFESVKKGQLPTSGNHAKRDFDLIEVVAKKPGYEDTKLIFNSNFWILLDHKTKNIYIDNQRALLAQSILDAVRNYPFDPDTVLERQSSIEKKWKYQQINPQYRNITIPKFLLAPTNFDQLAAIGFLYRSAYLSCQPSYAECLRKLFLEKLNEVFKFQWLTDELKKELFRLSMEMILCPISLRKRDKNNATLEQLNNTPELHKDISIRYFLEAHHNLISN